MIALKLDESPPGKKIFSQENVNCLLSLFDKSNMLIWANI